MGQKPTYKELEQKIHTLEQALAQREKTPIESEAFSSKNLVEDAPQAISVVDPDGAIRYVNPAFEELTGYTLKEISGCKPPYPWWPKDAVAHIGKEFRAAMVQGVKAVEFQMEKKNGTPFWVAIRSAALESEGGNKYLLANLVDITERKIVEEKLRTRASELEALNLLGQRVSLSVSIQETINTSLNHIVSHVAPDMTLFFLKEADDLHLKGFAPADGPISADDVPVHRVGVCLCGLAISNDTPIYSPNIHKDPRCTLEECKNAGFHSFVALPLKSENEIIGIIGIASIEERNFREQASFLEAMSNEVAIGLKSSILYEKLQTHALELQASLTQIKAAEAQSDQLKIQLQQAHKMEAIGTLAGGIAHDFNNILSAIIGFTEMSLEDVDKASTVYQYLLEVLKGGERAKNLVEQILTFSRQADPVLAPIKIKSIVIDALELVRASLPATIEIEQDLSSESSVLADMTQIHQIVMNLSANASHAMKDGPGVLTVELTDVNLYYEFISMHPQLKRGSYIKLRIGDSGHGISPFNMDRIFDPFFTTKPPGTGTGLGLSVVHGIVRGLGGEVLVNSEPSRGTTFDVFIPTIQKEVEPDSIFQRPIPTGDERILFVDDEQSINQLNQKILESLGYDVSTNADPLEALELFRAGPNRFDVIITDLTMPKMTGKELAREIRRVRPDIPIILCTGFSADVTDKDIEHQGLSALIYKPILKRTLAETIRKVLADR